VYRFFILLGLCWVTLAGSAQAGDTATLDQTARYLAGLPQLQDDSPLKSREQASAWLKHKRSMDSNWKRLVDLRLGKMKAWSSAEFQGLVDPSLTMLYPFSGPDFVSAHTFYPSAPRYVFFALEEIGPGVELGKLSDRQVDRTLRAVDYALRDIYSKGYFITTHMQSDIEASSKADAEGQGVIPVFLVFMARTGHELVSMTQMTATADGQLVPRAELASGRVNAVRFRFKDQGSETVQELVYFSVNQHDSGLSRRPGYVRFLESLPPTNTFMKAASYLLFGRTGEGFLTTRSLILGKSRSLFQDDTGMPLKHLVRSQWSLQLYGKYTKPIADFGKSCYQEDLEELYEKTPRSELKRLPFAMGYHVVGDRVHNHLLATKRPAEAKPAR
jgi:hypothetical protein